MTAVAFEADVDSLALVGVEVGETVKARRERLGVTKTALAKRAGVDVSRVRKVEAGVGLRDSTMRAIERALDAFEDEERHMDSPSVEQMVSVIELADGTRVTFTGSPENVVEAAHRFRQRATPPPEGV